MAQVRSTAATVGLVAITTVCPERRKRRMSDYLVPKFVVNGERNDVSTQVRVQRIVNGYVVKTGDKPIHYLTIEESAEAVKRGLMKAFCEEQRSFSCKSS
jgi:exosome complex RNA-binding protein Csl4